MTNSVINNTSTLGSLRLQDSTRCIIGDNEILGDVHGQNGLELHNSVHNQINDNIMRWAADGIKITGNCTTTKICDNQVLNCTGEFVNNQSTDKPEMFGNTFSNLYSG